MYFLAGAAAGGAIDLITSLTQTLSKTKSDATSAAKKAMSSFDVAGNPAATTVPTDGSWMPGKAPMTPGTMNALLSAQGQRPDGGRLSSKLFSLLDGDGNGAVSKDEFAQAFARTGDSTKADSVFGRVDTNGDGSISLAELASALKPGRHNRPDKDAVDAAGATDGTSKDRKSGSTAETVTNPDGSVTTTITYSDGTKVSMTQPAAGTANNVLERMIQRQAQMLGASTAGQSLAVTA